MLHQLRRNIGDPRTTILFVGYQAEYTLDRKLLQGDKIVRIFGRSQEVRAKIEEIDAYSAHTDEGEILDFIGQIPNKIRPGVCGAQRDAGGRGYGRSLRKSGIRNVTIPAGGERFQI